MISGIAHTGIRVHDLARSVAFHRVLGFELTEGPIGPEPVAILMHPAGVEINLVLNAASAHEPNIPMDVPAKHAGITHIALLVPDLDAARVTIEAAGVPPSGPRVLHPGSRSHWDRDPRGGGATGPERELIKK